MAQQGAKTALTRKSHLPQKLLEGSLGKRSPQRPTQTPALCVTFWLGERFRRWRVVLTLDAHRQKRSLGNTCVSRGQAACPEEMTEPPTESNEQKRPRGAARSATVSVRGVGPTPAGCNHQLVFRSLSRTHVLSPFTYLLH